MNTEQFMKPLNGVMNKESLEIIALQGLIKPLLHLICDDKAL